MKNFPETTDEEFIMTLMNILDLSAKDNTYKFAFMRFLLDYCNEQTETHIQFEIIATYFFKYYWLQECKSRLKQAPQIEKKPEIIKIIRSEFDKSYYPQTFEEIKKEESKKIQKCIEKIIKYCFHNVVWRFQKIKSGDTTNEKKIFYDYKIARNIHSNKKFVDLNYGIILNPNAMRFFKKYNVVLKKAVILEWVKFLEKLNLGIPLLIQKTEGEIIPRTNLTKYRKELEPFFKNCFYCNTPLKSGKETNVEHVIPFDYIAEDKMWNFVLACQKCNCKKLGSLPSKKYLDQLINRNNTYREKMPMLNKSLVILGTDFEKIIRNHFENAKSHGYIVLNNFL